MPMKYLIILLIFHISFGIGQTIQLNEIVSSNGDNLYDEDGDTPDWIEIYNPGPEVLNLSGFGLSDDTEDFHKWIFPDMNINPNDFIVVLASEKNRTDIINDWDAIIDWGDTWSFFPGTSSPISEWYHPQTDISSWSTGNSGFGYGDGDDNTNIPQAISVYVRKDFIIEDASTIVKALFHLDYDDGYVAYLNGIEFSRRNLGAPGSPVYYNTTTTALHEAEIYSGGFPEQIIIDLDQYPLIDGLNTLAIEVHNYNSNSSDLSCIPFLTLGYNTISQENNEPNDLMQLPESFLHTNFRISSGGETLILSDENEVILDSIFIDILETDMSFGRQYEGDNWSIFSSPTPWESNDNPSFIGALNTPQFSIESGFFNSTPLILEITSFDENASIYFTTDGSKPTQESSIYEEPLLLFSTSVIRARSFLEGWVPSEIESKTFIYGQDYSEELPKIFITTDPNSFFDEDTGMYVHGPNYEQNFPYFGSNFWEDWERPIHFEIREPDGSGYAANAGVKIFGGWSRAFPQKSLSIFARSHYGPSSFEYSLFPDSDVDEYEAFVLRNSGNDWESTVMRDGFITSIADDLNIDHQRYRPALLFLNGEFWGIQNIREKVNEHFISSNHSIAPEHIDLLDIQGINEENIVHGTNADYQILINYLETQEMNDPLVQNAIENWIDIESYMSYQAFQIFIDNRDWPGNNIKFWRDHRVGGKWRWILYDTDFGFSIWDSYAYTFNTLSFALDPYGPGWPNPPWSTFVFRKLMENNTFENIFINTYCDMLNTVFQPEFLSNHLDSISGNIESIIPTHRSRWYNNGNWPNSAINWEERLNIMENFGNNRRSYAINHLRNELDLPNLAQLTINISPVEAGSVDLNTLSIEESSWSGYYFPGIPINVSAKPNDGFIFSHWLEFPDSNHTIHVDITNPFTLTAIFTPTELTSGNVVINEINYNSSDDFDPGDWIELFNSGELDLDMSGWIFQDDNDDHVYNFPESTILNSNSYLIIARYPDLFNTSFPNIEQVLGPFDFGLGGGGDEIRIFDSEGNLKDSVSYDDTDPWPIEPDGNGPTLELINPDLDNALASSWVSSQDYGTPGEENIGDLTSEELEQVLPKETSLLAAYPNPFNGRITIPFQLADYIESEIIIYNILGKEIQRFSMNHFTPGKYTISWNAKNKLGQKVSTGVYFVKLHSTDSKSVEKIIYLK